MIEWEAGSGGGLGNLGALYFNLLNSDVQENQIAIKKTETHIKKNLLVDGDISGKDLALNDPSGVEIDLDSTNAGFRFSTVDSLQLLGLSSRNTGTILTYADTDETVNIRKKLICQSDISGKDLALNDPSGVEIDLDSTNAGFRFSTVDSSQLLGLSSRNTGTVLTYADTDETVNIRKNLYVKVI